MNKPINAPSNTVNGLEAEGPKAMQKKPAIASTKENTANPVDIHRSLENRLSRLEFLVALGFAFLFNSAGGFPGKIAALLMLIYAFVIAATQLLIAVTEIRMINKKSISQKYQTGQEGQA